MKTIKAKHTILGVAVALAPAIVLGWSVLANAQLLPVSIVTADRIYRVQISGGTVADALREAGVRYDADDVLLPPPTARLAPGECVTLHRVEKTVVDRDAEIPAKSVRSRVAFLARGAEVVLAEGTPGRARVEIEVVRVDGRPYAENLLSSRVLEEPVARRLLVGTGRAAPRGKGPFRMQASAYTPGPESCSGTADGRTATGRWAGFGVAAVDPSVIPLGTRLYVEGYGHAVAADVGSAIRGDRIDLCFDDVAAARRFGRRAVQVRVL